MIKQDKKIIYTLHTILIIAIFASTSYVQYLPSWFHKIIFIIIVSCGLTLSYVSILITAYQLPTLEREEE